MPLEIAVGTHFPLSAQRSTKTTPIFLPSDGEASWLLLLSTVFLLECSTMQPENTDAYILKEKGQVWEIQKWFHQH